MRAAHSRKADGMSLYSGVPFTIGLFLLVISFAMVVSGWPEKVTSVMQKVSLWFLIVACVVMPLGWFLDIPMYQGFFGLAIVGVLLAALLAIVEHRQNKGAQ